MRSVATVPFSSPFYKLITRVNVDHTIDGCSNICSCGAQRAEENNRGPSIYVLYGLLCD